MPLKKLRKFQIIAFIMSMEKSFLNLKMLAENVLAP
jgi:hypothetical protein